jgi:hypothetical protein
VTPIDKRDSCRVLVGRHERKRLLSRPKRRSEDNIKVNLKEIG